MTAKIGMKAISLPLWARVVLLTGVVCLGIGIALAAYRFYARPTTLSLAVGLFDGEATQIASIVASRLAATNSSVRLNVIRSDSILDSAKMFTAGKTDLAVVRADVGDLSQARSVALVSKGVLMILALPGSGITSIEKLKGRAVGVVGGEVNQGIVDALKKEYDLADRVSFRNMAPTETIRAIQSREISALLVVVPLNEKYLSLVKRLFRDSKTSFPLLIPVELAGAIADDERAYESFDVPLGTLRGTPPVPDADLTTLRVGTFLVANKNLDADLITTLTQALMNARNDLVRDHPLLAGIAAPDTDPDAYIAVHPGAAAFYDGTQQSFMDRYSNWIYLTPMILGAIASIGAAAWRFLGIPLSAPEETTLKTLFVLPRRIREAASEAELVAVAEEADQMLEAQLTKAIHKSPGALDVATLISLAHQTETLIDQRRHSLTTSPRDNQFRVQL